MCGTRAQSHWYIAQVHEMDMEAPTGPPTLTEYGPVLQKHLGRMRDALARLGGAMTALDTLAGQPLGRLPKEAVGQGGEVCVRGAMIVAASPAPTSDEFEVWDHTPVLNHPPVFLDLVEGKRVHLLRGRHSSRVVDTTPSTNALH